MSALPSSTGTFLRLGPVFGFEVGLRVEGFRVYRGA